MTGSRGRSGKPGRTMAPDEAELWSRVAGSVDKVRAKPRVPSHSDETPTAPAAAAKAPPESSPKPRRPRGAAVPLPPAQPAPPRLKPLAEFDRRAVRQVASGKAQIDARLDLHGMRQRDARIELHAFLRAAQARGCRTVLVITGKGDPGTERDHLAGALGKPQRGVLRTSVPQWLAEPELRAVVLSYTSAGVRHGGEGALYVQLRKAPQS
jgi:DNA-nicking Smr family endonuclease